MLLRSFPRHVRSTNQLMARLRVQPVVLTRSLAHEPKSESEVEFKFKELTSLQKQYDSSLKRLEIQVNLFRLILQEGAKAEHAAHDLDKCGQHAENLRKQVEEQHDEIFKGLGKFCPSRIIR